LDLKIRKEKLGPRLRGGDRLLALACALVLASCAQPGLQQVKPRLEAGDSGTVWFATPGRLNRNVATGDLSQSKDPLVLSGELYFPEGKGPFPAVILAHGCGGIGNAEAGWAPVLRQWGYATFVVDSFRGRSIREVCTDASLLSGNQRIPDAYGALKILATHPRIDARRVALMGFSHGGIVTVGSATAWARQHYLTPGTAGFRAFLPFYPSCNTIYPEVENLAGPMRIHTGVLDDWTPAAPCAQMVERIRKRGQDAAITLYPGAHHSFDNVGVPVRRLATVQNYAKCFWTASSMLGPFKGQPATTCRTTGATLGVNDEAVAQARRNVRQQLSELVK
jgi:dienelactone hydrolase